MTSYPQFCQSDLKLVRLFLVNLVSNKSCVGALDNVLLLGTGNHMIFTNVGLKKKCVPSPDELQNSLTLMTYDAYNIKL